MLDAPKRSLNLRSVQDAKSEEKKLLCFVNKLPQLQTRDLIKSKAVSSHR